MHLDRHVQWFPKVEKGWVVVVVENNALVYVYLYKGRSRHTRFGVEGGEGMTSMKRKKSWMCTNILICHVRQKVHPLLFTFSRPLPTR